MNFTKMNSEENTLDFNEINIIKEFEKMDKNAGKIKPKNFFVEYHRIDKNGNRLPYKAQIVGVDREDIERSLINRLGNVQVMIASEMEPIDMFSDEIVKKILESNKKYLVNKAKEEKSLLDQAMRNKSFRPKLFSD